ncbi:MAG: hypothetical protein HXL22_02225 [Peptostreptococcus sp.]|jgi:hypothetical protein|uniref:DUF5685 family protein n=1 Tax=Peptostreptococcus sp. TaxID=1262 RepID=UPI001CAFC29A|nr:DUF5685 family protein [Peptostreptococcus sp.]MBF1044827.1 hypothetical protein [Peptostreptococcus sp.]MBF1045677.1 hypothetical protein [Peptostreptococcus sp.]MBF1048194.1 hypothetical protein [Peptostreptococcus sp.]MBF1050367.1 hypothetical protein [Peptostreptococcus sp.]MBF1057607.1 hypothetical protein [Peptostreptococcus sp.]
MFGYVRINKMDLTFREYEHYKAYYCGLCKYLKRNHTELSRMTINYDITFLIVLLSSIYQPSAQVFHEKCIVDPVKKKKHIINEITEYAASMNILLAYYKLEDDVNDEGDIKSRLVRRAYRKSFKTAYDKYPQKADFIKACLGELRSLEEDQSTSIDQTSNCFARLLEEIFDYKDDEYRDRLRKVGFNIGKYIYIMDAYEDLDQDLEKGRYNPFSSYKDDREGLKVKVDKLIGMTLARLEEAILNLDIKVNKSIIDNIIYSGVYLRYKGLINGADKKKQEANMK